MRTLVVFLLLVGMIACAKQEKAAMDGGPACQGGGSICR